jgi:Flp pilus assembly protein TadG
MANRRLSFIRKFALKRPTENGQALVEFALVLMFIILPFTFVLVDGVMTLFTLANVTNAAREGARAGSIFQISAAPGGTFSDQVATIDALRATTSISPTIQKMLGPLVAYSQCTTAITYNPATPSLGNPYRELDSVTVQLACPRRMLFGLINVGSITLTSSATMRIEPGGVAPAS